MMIVYYHSPLPPEKSGIADYSSELLPLLGRFYEIILVSDSVREEWEQSSGFRWMINSAKWRAVYKPGVDLNLYHIGNNSDFFLPLLERALEKPGLLVIHDVSLMSLLTGAGLAYFERFLEYDLGTTAHLWLKKRQCYPLYDWQDFAIRCLGLLIDSSLGVIAHSEYAIDLIQRRYNPKFCIHVQHHISKDFIVPITKRLESERTQTFIDGSRNAIKIGTFGYLTPPKRIDWLVAAFKRLLSDGIDACLILAGQPHPATNIDGLIRDIPAHRVHVTGFLSEPDMRSIMSAIDLQVNLRFPSVGESSGTLTRALGLGTPCVVLDYEAFADYPDHFLTKVPLTDHVFDDLYDVFVEFARDPSPYRENAALAQKYITTNASIENSTKGYVKAIDEALSNAIVPSNYIKKLADIITDALEMGHISTLSMLHSVDDIRRHVFSIAVEQNALEDCRASCHDFGHHIPHLGFVGAFSPERADRCVVVATVDAETHIADLRRSLNAVPWRRFDVVLLVRIPQLMSPRMPVSDPWCSGLDEGGMLAETMIVRRMRDMKVTFDDPLNHRHDPSSGPSVGVVSVVALEVL